MKRRGWIRPACRRAKITDLLRELKEVFTSNRPRAHESARTLSPHANLVVDPLFAEAPLAGPKIPLLKMRVAKWAVVARLLWHAGYHPGIENYASARARVPNRPPEFSPRKSWTAGR